MDNRQDFIDSLVKAIKTELSELDHLISEGNLESNEYWMAENLTKKLFGADCPIPLPVHERLLKPFDLYIVLHKGNEFIGDKELRIIVDDCGDDFYEVDFNDRFNLYTYEGIMEYAMFRGERRLSR